MKHLNLLLLALLLIALLAGYILLERKENVAQQLHNLHQQDFLALEWKQQRHPKESLSPEILARLGALDVTRIFTSEEAREIAKNFSSSEDLSLHLHFRDHTLHLTFGDQLPHNDNFYLNITLKDKTYYALARDTTPYMGVFANQQELRAYNYLWWVKLLK